MLAHIILDVHLTRLPVLDHSAAHCGVRACSMLGVLGRYDAKLLLMSCAETAPCSILIEMIRFARWRSTLLEILGRIFQHQNYPFSNKDLYINPCWCWSCDLLVLGACKMRWQDIRARFLFPLLLRALLSGCRLQRSNTAWCLSGNNDCSHHYLMPAVLYSMDHHSLDWFPAARIQLENNYLSAVRGRTRKRVISKQLGSIRKNTGCLVLDAFSIGYQEMPLTYASC